MGGFILSRAGVGADSLVWKAGPGHRLEVAFCKWGRNPFLFADQGLKGLVLDLIEVRPGNPTDNTRVMGLNLTYLPNLPILEISRQNLDVPFFHDVVNNRRGDLEIGHGLMDALPEAGPLSVSFSQE